MADMLVVVAGNSAFNIDTAGRNLAFRVLKVVQVKGLGVAECVHEYHAAGLALAEEFVNSHCKFGAICKVVGDRVLAADVVADFNRTGLHLQTDLLEFFLENIVEQHSLADFAQLRMSVFVISHGNACVLDLLGIEVMENAFRNHHGAVGNAQKLALDYGGKGELHDLVQGNASLVEHLGDDCHRAVGCLADTECEVSCAASHCAYKQPVA